MRPRGASTASATASAQAPSCSPRSSTTPSRPRSWSYPPTPSPSAASWCVPPTAATTRCCCAPTACSETSISTRAAPSYRPRRTSSTSYHSASIASASYPARVLQCPFPRPSRSGSRRSTPITSRLWGRLAEIRALLYFCSYLLGLTKRVLLGGISHQYLYIYDTKETVVCISGSPRTVLRRPRLLRDGHLPHHAALP